MLRATERTPNTSESAGMRFSTGVVPLKRRSASMTVVPSFA